MGAVRARRSLKRAAGAATLYQRIDRVLCL